MARLRRSKWLQEQGPFPSQNSPTQTASVQESPREDGEAGTHCGRGRAERARAAGQSLAAGAQAGEATELLQRKEGSAQASAEDAAHKHLHLWAFFFAGSSPLQTKASPVKDLTGKAKARIRMDGRMSHFDWQVAVGCDLSTRLKRVLG